MGPRPELVEEIFNIAKVDFYMYSSERFLFYGQEFHKGKINKKALQEIKEMARPEFERSYNGQRIKSEQEEMALRIREERRYIGSKIQKINMDIEFQKNKMCSLELKSTETPGLPEEYHNQAMQLSELIQEKNMLDMKMISIEENNLKYLEYTDRKFYRDEVFTKHNIV